MTSYFSNLKLGSVSAVNLGTSISTRFQTVRQALTSNSEKDDENDENLSHVSNTLRAYYTEKGRPFPPWLPPDPRAPVPQIPVVAQANVGAGYGNMNNYNQRGPNQGRGGLSDLWDSNPASNPTTPPASQSLRRPGGGPRPSHISSNSMSGPPSPPQQMGAARPLPSQRAGSYQTSAAMNQPGFNRVGSNGSTNSVGSAQNRLKARLQGGGGGRDSPSPAPSNYTANSYTSSGGGGGQQAYMGSSRPWDSGGGANGFDGGYGGGGGGGGAPPPASRRPPGMGLPSNPRGPRGPR